MEDTIEKKKKQKLPLAVKIPVITIICIISFFAIWRVVVFIYDKVDKDNTNQNDTSYNLSYDISYTSIEVEENCVWVNFSIEAENMITFYVNDFSVMVGGIPMRADSILTGTYTTITPNGVSISKSTSSSHSTREVLIVCFDYTKEELDKPLQFYYKGKLLELGQSQHFDK